MKDLIVGFEFEGTRYGALIEFTVEAGYVVAQTKELKSFSSPDPITDKRELNRIVHGAEHMIIPLIQEHMMKEYK